LSLERVKSHLVEESLRLLQKSILSDAVDLSSFLLLLEAVVNEFSSQVLENFEIFIIELSFKSVLLLIKELRE